MSIHVAITRRVRPGCEAEFQEALRQFFQTSFSHSAVLGASLLVPPPGSTTREYGILRTFGSEAERDAFYASELFKAWEERAGRLTEGEPVYRQLHGLEAWFRAPGPPPPRWKMALLSFAGVYPLTSLLPRLFGRWLAPWPPLLINVVVTGLIVFALTWVLMPVLTRVFRGWLHGGKN
ncbi:MAG: antibiotic biosynthesis monooxygenase [Verrucomicrobia bacterium]|nr:antibiotic biosynthesis monooxygenase [Verrucomicrobiota bacterium]